MARPYAGELSKLRDTYRWATTADIKPLCHAIRAASMLPLRVVGSGGSLTSAYALAGLHQRYAGQVATVATPLEALTDSLNPNVANWLLSAGGRNVDIIAVARTMILREPRQLAVLCGNEASPLADLCRQHAFVDLFVYSSPAGRDGFLATNSLFGFSLILTRAYATEFRLDGDWQDVVDHLDPLLTDTNQVGTTWEGITAPLWARPTTLVLYGPAAQIGALDLESKFTEAALGHVQIADYRNFAHGRHHWLAKRSDTSTVLAFITDADRALADRTLDLLPANVPQARIFLGGRPSASSLGSLLAALRITGWAGISRGIDPGRPGVPPFGRKLYRQPLPSTHRPATVSDLTSRETAAIIRKAGVDLSRLLLTQDLDRWFDALVAFRNRLLNARFAGIVLDYDGTVVDARQRFDLAQSTIASQITRLANVGARLAIATGRGKSVRHDLQRCLPHSIWHRVLVGYYNGAEVATLDDDTIPRASNDVSDALQSVSDRLRQNPELATNARQEDRRFQITLQASRMMPEDRLWDLVQHVTLQAGVHNVRVVRSSHSVDIVPAGVSKLNVVRRIRLTVGSAPILAIGDRGRWPGNDHELLSEPFALSVDEVNLDPATCWHLGEPGQRGPAVALDYLAALETLDNEVKFAAGSLK